MYQKSKQQKSYRGEGWKANKACKSHTPARLLCLFWLPPFSSRHRSTLLHMPFDCPRHKNCLGQLCVCANFVMDIKVDIATIQQTVNNSTYSPTDKEDLKNVFDLHWRCETPVRLEMPFDCSDTRATRGNYEETNVHSHFPHQWTMHSLL